MSDINVDIGKIDQRKQLVETILSHKKEHIDTFLSNRRLPYSYTKKTLKSKLIEGLDEEKFSEIDLIDLLDAIEEFGNQHIYLFNCNPDYLETLQDPSYIQGKLDENNLKNLYNNKHRIFIPNDVELSSVIHDDNTLKFKWVEKRIWKIPLDEDRIEDDKYIEVHQINISRGVTTFRVDLVSGTTELMIQKLSMQPNYKDIKEDYLHKLSNFVETYSFQQTRLRRAIKFIEESNEVEKRQINFETISGGKVAFKSRDRGADYTNDPSLSSARNALGSNVSGSLGNFYWKPNDILKRAIHTYIYSEDDRVGILGQCVEREVNYVLSRIRYFASR